MAPADDIVLIEIKRAATATLYGTEELQRRRPDHHEARIEELATMGFLAPAMPRRHCNRCNASCSMPPPRAC
jgi:hypothetical protein